MGKKLKITIKHTDSGQARTLSFGKTFKFSSKYGGSRMGKTTAMANWVNEALNEVLTDRTPLDVAIARCAEAMRG